MNTLLKKFLVLTAVSAVTITANATPVSTDFNNQDSIVMLGFRASAGTGISKNLLVSLGSVADLLGVNNGYAYGAQFDLSSALTSTFGSDWNRSTVIWGAYGAETTDYKSLIASESQPYLTQEQMDVFDPYSFVGAQAAIANSTTDAGAVSGIASATSASPLINNIYTGGYAWSATANTVSGSYSSYNSPAAPLGAFGYFSGEQNFDLGSTLRFALYDPNATPFAALDDLTVSLDTATGIVTLAVPEPSTYALAGFGLLALVIAARRRTALKA